MPLQPRQYLALLPLAFILAGMSIANTASAWHPVIYAVLAALASHTPALLKRRGFIVAFVGKPALTAVLYTACPVLGYLMVANVVQATGLPVLAGIATLVICMFLVDLSIRPLYRPPNQG